MCPCIYKSPIVKIIFDAEETKNGGSDQLHCIHCAKLTMCCLPCPQCPDVMFCSMECLHAALATYHFYECKMRLYGLLRLLSRDITNVSVGKIMVLRLVTQKHPDFFSKNAARFEEILQSDTRKAFYSISKSL